MDKAQLRPEIGVVFLDLTRETRERIIRYALDVQRERRRRGMM
jgi:c-di-GMP-binding flagellar brake protein YcgR